MWFWLFTKACRKYNFFYALSDYWNLEIVLNPIYEINTHLNVFEDSGSYYRLFRKAIKTMKEYRRKR